MSTSKQLERGKSDEVDAPRNIVVAVKASREIAKTALVWALEHVAQPGDCITLIVVVSPHNSGTPCHCFWCSWLVSVPMLLFLELLCALVRSAKC